MIIYEIDFSEQTPATHEEARVADRANDAPHRRTEPAITVPPFERDDVVTWDGRFDGRVCAVYPQSVHGGGFLHIEITRSNDERMKVGQHTTIALSYAKKVDPGELVYNLHFEHEEVQACKDHGEWMYMRTLSDVLQVRELLAVEEAKVEMEAWRLSNGEWLEWQTSGDSAALLDADLNADMDEQREVESAWLRSLTPPQEHESLGDWAGRQPQRPFGRGCRAYMQHLYDRLARDGAIEETP
jgi:hypothetical protein